MTETTKMKDTVITSKETSYAPVEIPLQDVPPSRMFDIRDYKGGDWVLIFMDKETYETLKKLCEARSLDVKKVLYGAIMKTKELLQGEEKEA